MGARARVGVGVPTTVRPMVSTYPPASTLRRDWIVPIHDTSASIEDRRTGDGRRARRADDRALSAGSPAGDNRSSSPAAARAAPGQTLRCSRRCSWGPASGVGDCGECQASEWVPRRRPRDDGRRSRTGERTGDPIGQVDQRPPGDVPLLRGARARPRAGGGLVPRRRSSPAARGRQAKTLLLEVAAGARPLPARSTSPATRPPKVGSAQPHRPRRAASPPNRSRRRAHPRRRRAAQPPWCVFDFDPDHSPPATWAPSAGRCDPGEGGRRRADPGGETRDVGVVLAAYPAGDPIAVRVLSPRVEHGAAARGQRPYPPRSCPRPPTAWRRRGDDLDLSAGDGAVADPTGLFGPVAVRIAGALSRDDEGTHPARRGAGPGDPTPAERPQAYDVKLGAVPGWRCCWRSGPALPIQLHGHDVFGSTVRGLRLGEP